MKCILFWLIDVSLISRYRLLIYDPISPYYHSSPHRCVYRRAATHDLNLSSPLPSEDTYIESETLKACLETHA